MATETDNDSKPFGGTPEQRKVRYWLNELEGAFSREKSWRKRGLDLCSIYEAGDKAAEHPYNILYANTATLSPAVYNSTPKPRVTARFINNQNPMNRMAAFVGQRLLQYAVGNPDPRTPTFDSVMVAVVDQALVPGRGLLRLRFDAKLPAEGEVADPTEAKVVVEKWPWDRFLHGFADEWHKLPWIAFTHAMTKDEVEENFGKAIGAQLNFAPAADGSGDGANRVTLNSIFRDVGETELKGAEAAVVHEIWCKKDKKVLFISPDMPDRVLKEVDDPMQLEGFFPTVEPLVFYKRINSLLPQAFYEAYKTQAEELNDLTIRITKLVRALRVRGFYDSTYEGIEDLLKAGDNELKPIANPGQLATQGQKLSDIVSLLDLSGIVAALAPLYNQRQQVKSIIFEISGIADIMRGSSAASETLGAQQLKNQWGTLRLKRSQKEVANFITKTLALILEAMVTLIPPETLRAMSDLPFPMRAELQQMQAQFQQFSAQAVAAGQQPPPPPPELQSPAFEDIIEVLQNDMARNFAVTIEPNSTVDAEATDDKQDVAELMNALGQFLNGIYPMVERGAVPDEVAKLIMINLLRRFRMGSDIEEALSKPSQQQQGPNPQQLQQQQQEMQKQAEELQKQQQDLEAQKKEMEMQARQQQDELTMNKKFQEQEIAMAQEMAKKELDLYRTMMQRQIEQEKAMALKEIAMAQQLAAGAVPADPGEELEKTEPQPTGENNADV